MSKNKYDTHVLPKLALVEAWARDGLSQEQIAHNLGVADSTFRSYKEAHPALSAALARGKEVVDVEVENALLKKAKGYDFTEVTKQLKTDPETGEPVMVVTKEVTRHMPGDVTAQMFWLANRRPEHWKYRPEAAEEREEDGGVVVLAPVMENPGKQEGPDGNA